MYTEGPKAGANDLGGGSVDAPTVPLKVARPDAPHGPEPPNPEAPRPRSWAENTNFFMDQIRGNEAAGAFLDTLVGPDANAQSLQDSLVQGKRKDIKNFIKHVDSVFDPSQREHRVVAGILSQLLKDTNAGDQLESLLRSKTATEQTQTEGTPRERYRRAKAEAKAEKKSRERTMPPWRRRLHKAGRVLAVTAALGMFGQMAASQTDQDLAARQAEAVRILDAQNAEKAAIEAGREIPLQVTDEDLSHAFNSLQTQLGGFRGGGAQDQVFYESPSTFSRPGFAWEQQHPLAALTTYESIYGELPAGLPDPSKVAANYWSNGNGADSPPGYYVQADWEGGLLYTDDGAWLANLELDRVPHLIAEGKHAEAQASIDRAQAMFQTAMNNRIPEVGNLIGWQYNNSEKKEDKVLTVSNAPIAELGIKLYNLDPNNPDNQRYIDAAQEIYDGVRDHLYDPQDHLYYDNINYATGEVNRDKVSYAQGTMITLGIQLAEVTGDDQYLRDAEATVRTILEHDNLTEKPNLEFDAILLKAMAKLYAVTEDHNLQRQLSNQIVKYGNALVNNPEYWDRAEGKYIDGASDHGTYVMNQGGATEILTLATFMGNQEISTEDKVRFILDYNGLDQTPPGSY